MLAGCMATARAREDSRSPKLDVTQDLLRGLIAETGSLRSTGFHFSADAVGSNHHGSGDTRQMSDRLQNAVDLGQRLLPMSES